MSALSEFEALTGDLCTVEGPALAWGLAIVAPQALEGGLCALEGWASTWGLAPREEFLPCEAASRGETCLGGEAVRVFLRPAGD